MRKSIAEDAEEGDGDREEAGVEAVSVCFSPPGELAASADGEAATSVAMRRRLGIGGVEGGRVPRGLKLGWRRWAEASEGMREASEGGLQRKKARLPLPIFLLPFFFPLTFHFFSVCF